MIVLFFFSFFRINNWAVEHSEILGRGPGTCMIFLYLSSVWQDKTLNRLIYKRHHLGASGTAYSYTISVLDLFSSEEIFTFSKYFWRDEETILALFREWKCQSYIWRLMAWLCSSPLWVIAVFASMCVHRLWPSLLNSLLHFSGADLVSLHCRDRTGHQFCNCGTARPDLQHQFLHTRIVI